MFDNSTFNVPDGYEIAHVYVYDANDTWINTPLAVYIKNVYVDDIEIYHNCLSNFNFDRNKVSALTESLTTQHGNLKFLIKI